MPKDDPEGEREALRVYGVRVVAISGARDDVLLCSPATFRKLLADVRTSGTPAPITEMLRPTFATNCPECHSSVTVEQFDKSGGACPHCGFREAGL
jgi:hypothetical protein